MNRGRRYIGDSTFSNCSGLTGLTLPDKLTGIDESAFLTAWARRWCSSRASENIIVTGNSPSDAD